MSDERPGDWFTLVAGQHPHLVGWSLTALDGRPVAVCPVCHALVFADADMRAHERWHANSDHPIPETLR
jgi:hypothetical protein